MSKLSLQIGFWTSGFLSFLGAAYLVILAGVPSMGALTTMEPTGPRALWAGLDTLLAAVGLVILIACVAQVATPEKKVLGVIGFAFTIFFAIVMVGFLARGPVLGVTVILLGFLFWRDSRS